MAIVVGCMFDQAPWMIVHSSHFVHMWSIVKEKWLCRTGPCGSALFYSAKPDGPSFCRSSTEITDMTFLPSK
jgi:hypothetical protein